MKPPRVSVSHERGLLSDPPDPRQPDPEAAAISGALRESWREEQESAAADAAEDFQHRRTLRDALREFVARGDRVVIEIGRRRFVGELIGVGDDVASLKGGGERIDVHLASAMPPHFSVVERARSGGRSPTGSYSWRARLLELELAERDVELGYAGTDLVVVGRLNVGADHVVVRGRDRSEHFLPIAGLVYVLVRFDA